VALVWGKSLNTCPFPKSSARLVFKSFLFTLRSFLTNFLLLCHLSNGAYHGNTLLQGATSSFPSHHIVFLHLPSPFCVAMKRCCFSSFWSCELVKFTRRCCLRSSIINSVVTFYMLIMEKFIFTSMHINIITCYDFVDLPFIGVLLVVLLLRFALVQCKFLFSLKLCKALFHNLQTHYTLHHILLPFFLCFVFFLFISFTLLFFNCVFLIDFRAKS